MEGTVRSYYLKTFGCQMNYADSEKVNMALLQSGFLKVLDPAMASVVVLNTCSVRQKGEDRVFGYVREVKKLSQKLGRPILVGITGCMVRKTGIARRYLAEDVEKVATKGKIELLKMNDLSSEAASIGVFENLFMGDGFQKPRSSSAPENHFSIFNWDDDLFTRSKDIDFVFRIEETGYLPKLLSAITGQQIGNDEKWEEYLKMRGVRENPAQANVIIQTGCDNFCTFCIVPHTRGREISRPLDEIVNEVAEAATSGAKEVTFLGQNVNSYGKDSKKKLWNADSLMWNVDSERGLAAEKTPFRELLEAVNGIPGIKRVRFTSSNPHDMTRDILDAHFELKAMMPYLHLALQSGSDTVL
jgi:tRNA-2-methylthio-N6-dimethylallyladenosine synthase